MRQETTARTALAPAIRPATAQAAAGRLPPHERPGRRERREVGRGLGPVRGERPR